MTSKRIERGEKTPKTPKISALVRKRPVLLRANFVLTKDRKRPYYGHFSKCTGRGLVVKRPGVLSNRSHFGSSQAQDVNLARVADARPETESRSEALSTEPARDSGPPLEIIGPTGPVVYEPAAFMVRTPFIVMGQKRLIQACGLPENPNAIFYHAIKGGRESHTIKHISADDLVNAVLESSEAARVFPVIKDRRSVQPQVDSELKAMFGPSEVPEDDKPKVGLPADFFETLVKLVRCDKQPCLKGCKCGGGLPFSPTSLSLRIDSPEAAHLEKYMRIMSSEYAAQIEATVRRLANVSREANIPEQLCPYRWCLSKLVTQRYERMRFLAAVAGQRSFQIIDSLSLDAPGRSALKDMVCEILVRQPMNLQTEFSDVTVPWTPSILHYDILPGCRQLCPDVQLRTIAAHMAMHCYQAEAVSRLANSVALKTLSSLIN